MTGRAERRLVIGLWVLTVAGLLAPLAISPPPATQMVWGVAYAAIPSAGAFILVRSHGNRIGWLLIAGGPLLAFGISGQAVARLGLESGSAWAPYPLLVGAGFDPTVTAKGHGTTNTDRLDALGGQLETISSPGGGTRIAGALPAKRRIETALVERTP